MNENKIWDDNSDILEMLKISDKDFKVATKNALMSNYKQACNK